MALVRFATAEGDVAVKLESLIAVLPQGARGAHLWWDAPREVVTTEGLDQIQAKLGAGFVAMQPGDPTAATFLVNPDLVLAVIPHPEITDVCFLQGASRRLTVRGDLDAILRQLVG